MESGVYGKKLIKNKEGKLIKKGITPSGANPPSGPACPTVNISKGKDTNSTNAAIRIIFLIEIPFLIFSNL